MLKERNPIHKVHIERARKSSLRGSVSRDLNYIDVRDNINAVANA